MAISTTLDPSQGLTALAVDLLDPTSLIDRRCSLRSSASKSQFTLAGRGGLPPAPGSGVELSNPGDDLRLSRSGSLGLRGSAALRQGVSSVMLSAWSAGEGGGKPQLQEEGVPRLGDCQ
ncbi:MAG: hypothetical protein ACO331_08050 [Prochlorothrix sp.]